MRFTVVCATHVNQLNFATGAHFARNLQFEFVANLIVYLPTFSWNISVGIPFDGINRLERAAVVGIGVDICPHSSLERMVLVVDFRGPQLDGIAHKALPQGMSIQGLYSIIKFQFIYKPQSAIFDSRFI